MKLYQYVDFFPYCNELSEITGLSIDNIIMIVSKTFKKIEAGSLDSVSGFEEIEEELAKQMLISGIVIPPIEQESDMKQMVC